MRRRREPRLPGDAATRQQSDRVVAEEPGRALGSVARIRVLRKEDYNRTSKPLVQRREQERQRRLRHPRARRQRNGNDPYDFFDVPSPALLTGSVAGKGDGAISIRDVISILAYVGTSAADTDITAKRVRRAALHHALLSYVFGTVIVAITVSSVAGLLGR